MDASVNGGNKKSATIHLDRLRVDNVGTPTTVTTRAPRSECGRLTRWNEIDDHLMTGRAGHVEPIPVDVALATLEQELKELVTTEAVSQRLVERVLFQPIVALCPCVLDLQGEVGIGLPEGQEGTVVDPQATTDARHDGHLPELFEQPELNVPVRDIGRRRVFFFSIS